MKVIIIISLLFGFLFSSCIARPLNIISTPSIDIEFTPTQTFVPILKPTQTFQPSPTPLAFKINPDFPKVVYQELADNYEKICEDFSVVSYDDLASGRLLVFEIDFISKNPVFNDQVKNSKIEIEKIDFSANHGTFSTKLINILGVEGCRYNSELRPIKIISYYIFRDEELFTNLGINPIKNDGSWFDEKWPFWIMTWAYHNQDGSIILGHSFIKIFDYVNLVDRISRYKWRDCLKCEFHGSDFKPAPEYLYYDINIDEENITKINSLVLYKIYESYPDLIPDEDHINTWVSTGNMPQELQFKLFGLDTSAQHFENYNYWRY